MKRSALPWRRGLPAAWTGALLLAAGLALAPQIAAHLVFNRAKLDSEHDTPSVARYQQALALAPDDAHIRWQTGAAQAAAGDAAGAATTLLPLAGSRPLDPNLARTLLTSLAAARRTGDAVRLYSTLQPPPAVPTWLAARILDHALAGARVLPAETTAALLAQVFGLDPALPEFGTLAEAATAPGFAATARGRQVRATLAWRGQAPPAQPPSGGPAEDDRAAAARLLGVPATTVGLGPELVSNGGFEQQGFDEDAPPGWQPAFMSSGRPWNFALFAAGADDEALAGRRALRIDGLQIADRPDREPARAGLWHTPITVTAGAAYFISLAYRTARVGDPGATLWLSENPALLLDHEQPLPATGGRWRRLVAAGWNRSGKPATIAPLLRLFSTGTVWFDDLSLRALTLATPIAPRAAIVRFEDATGP